jgi:hypothetical protein
VCLADDRDGDEVGPSLCDPEQPDERTLSRGLARVWDNPNIANASDGNGDRLQISKAVAGGGN